MKHVKIGWKNSMLKKWISHDFYYQTLGWEVCVEMTIIMSNHFGQVTIEII